MIFLLVILIIGTASVVVCALMRGLFAFIQPGEQSFEKQNEMMFARVKWQAIVIVLLVLAITIASQ